MVLFALCMMTETAATGAILQMLSHGLMTALFFAVIPKVIKEGASKAEAEEIKTKLEAEGAKVTLK